MTLFGKNVVTIPKLTTSQSMKKGAHFQCQGWAGTEIQLGRKKKSPLTMKKSIATTKSVGLMLLGPGNEALC